MFGKDTISSLFWLFAGAWICYQGYDTGLGSLHEPGSGFLIFWAGIVMMVLSIIILIQALLKKKDRAGTKMNWASIRWGKIFLVSASLFAYGYALIPLGFVFTTILLLLFLCKMIEPQRWSVSIGVSLISTLCVYVVFQLWLGIQLPRGILSLW
ncbi:MAG: tripartite tricarboxylate transporter TctB family protein [Thermodesulfobacteriota bacterium]